MTSVKSISRTALSTVTATTIVSSLLTVQTRGTGFTDISAEVAKFVREAGAHEGAAAVFGEAAHTAHRIGWRRAWRVGRLQVGGELLSHGDSLSGSTTHNAPATTEIYRSAPTPTM